MADDPFAPLRDLVELRMANELEALEQLTYYAIRDDIGLVVERSCGLIVDAYLAPWMPRGRTIYDINLDALNATWPHIPTEARHG